MRMILTKRLTRKEVLETIAMVAAETLPPDSKGTIDVTYDEEDGVEIVYREPEEVN